MALLRVRTLLPMPPEADGVAEGRRELVGELRQEAVDLAELVDLAEAARSMEARGGWTA